MDEITIEESLVHSWRMYKRHIWILASSSTLIIGASFFVCVSFYLYQMQKNIFTLTLLLCMFVLLIILQLGFIKILLNITGNKTVQLPLLLKQYQCTIQYIVGTVAYILVVSGGLLLFIVPGVMWALRYSMWPLVMMNKDCGVFVSFAESSRLTKGSKINLLFLYLAITGGLIVSMIPLFLGLLVSYPVAALTYAHVYRRLQLIRTNETLQKKKEKKKEKVKAG